MTGFAGAEIGGDYSGGGGASGTGTGGGSFDGGLMSANLVQLASVRNGDGSVVITELSAAPVTTVPEPASLTLLGTDLLGLGLAVRHRKPS